VYRCMVAGGGKKACPPVPCVARCGSMRCAVREATVRNNATSGYVAEVLNRSR